MSGNLDEDELILAVAAALIVPGAARAQAAIPASPPQPRLGGAHDGF
jgi:hypothetical protein